LIIEGDEEDGVVDGIAVHFGETPPRLAVQLSIGVTGSIIGFGVADNDSTRTIRNELIRFR
jgi:hypothetical protein